MGGVGGEGSTEQHVKRLWSREGVRPLRVTKAGVAHEEGGRGKQVQPLRGLPFGLPLPGRHPSQKSMETLGNPCKCP